MTLGSLAGREVRILDLLSERSLGENSNRETSI